MKLIKPIPADGIPSELRMSGADFKKMFRIGEVPNDNAEIRELLEDFDAVINPLTVTKQNIVKPEEINQDVAIYDDEFEKTIIINDKTDGGRSFISGSFDLAGGAASCCLSFNLCKATTRTTEDGRLVKNALTAAHEYMVNATQATEIWSLSQTTRTTDKDGKMFVKAFDLMYDAVLKRLQVTQDGETYNVELDDNGKTQLKFLLGNATGIAKGISAPVITAERENGFMGIKNFYEIHGYNIPDKHFYDYMHFTQTL